MSEETTDLPEAELNTSQTAEDGVDTPTDDHDAGDLDADAAEGDEPEGQAATEEDDSEEIEVEGAKYKIPKAVKPLLLMEKDYRQKTMALAEERRALETKLTADVAQRNEFERANIADFAKLHTIDASLAEFKAVTQEQWDAMKAKDVDQYRELKDEYRDLKEARDALAGELSTKETEAKTEQERTSKEAIANQQRAMIDVLTGAAKHETGLDLAIPNLSKERLGKISDTAAKAYGFTGAELAQITDPRILKALDDAHLYRAGQAKAVKVARVEDSQKTTPAKAVGGAAPSARKTTDASGDGLSDEEWNRREQERLLAKRRPNRR